MKKLLCISLCFLFLFSGCGLTVEKVENSAQTTTLQEAFTSTEITEPDTENSTAKQTETTTKITEEKSTESATSKKTETATKVQNTEPTTEQKNTCTLTIECKTILNNKDKLKESKKDFLPSDGVILEKSTISFSKGETVFDVLIRVCKEKNIQIESSYTPGYDNYYVEGIAQIYEKDCGTKSGWMYCVNEVFPNYGCSDYAVKNGDDIKFLYTCDLGSDIENNSF